MLETRPNNNMLADLRERWEDIPVNQKLIAVAVICLLVASLVGVMATQKSDAMVPLFGSLSSTQAAEMVQKLEEGNHRFELADGGSLILVPEEDRQRLRLEMAGNGMLNQENPGFELFEKTTLSRSDFSERITYLRALQGELAATIEAIPQVRKARVHLNLPRRPLYLDEKQETSAAVYVELASGASLNKNQMAGIINLVASSVEGMTPAQVTLMDGSGALHMRGDQLDEQGGVGGDDNDRSKEMTRVAQELVDRVLGPGKAMATVRIELAREARTTEREMVEPGNDGKGVLLHQEEQIETFEGTKPNARQEIAQGAAPVTATTPPTAEQANGKTPSYQQKSTKADFAVSRVKEVLETRPGATSRLSASVIVDSKAGLSEDEMAALADGVKTAIGFDQARGDAFELRALTFNRDHLEAMQEEVAAENQKEADQKALLMYLLAGIGGTTVLGLLIGFILKRRKAREVVWMDVDVNPNMPQQEMFPERLDLALPAEMPPLPTEGVEELLVKALEAVEREPALVARLVERWANEGER